MCTPTSIHWTYDTYALFERHRQSDRQTRRKILVLPHAQTTRFGHALERDASKMVVAAGGKVLGSVRHPFGTADISSFLLQAQAAKPDIVGLANAGADFRNAVAQADEFGVRSGGAQIVALQVTLTDVPALGLEHAHDLLFTDSLSGIARRKRAPLRKPFSSATAPCRRHIRPGSIRRCAITLKRSPRPNSTDTATVIKWMRDNPVNDFFARGGKVRADGRMVHDMYLMRIKKPEESRSKWDLYEYLDTVPGDQAFRPMSEGGCPYVKQ